MSQSDAVVWCVWAVALPAEQGRNEAARNDVTQGDVPYLISEAAAWLGRIGSDYRR